MVRCAHLKRIVATPFLPDGVELDFFLGDAVHFCDSYGSSFNVYLFMDYSPYQKEVSTTSFFEKSRIQYYTFY